MFCPICKVSMTQIVLDTVSGAAEGYELTMHGFPVAECPHCGRRRFVSDKYVEAFDAEMYGAVRLPSSTSKSRWFRTVDLCLRCRSELPGDEVPGTLRFTVELPGLPVHSCELRGPVVACWQCGSQQVRTSGDAFANIGLAFSAAWRAGKVED